MRHDPTGVEILPIQTHASSGPAGLLGEASAGCSYVNSCPVVRLLHPYMAFFLIALQQVERLGHAPFCSPDD
jgi:hypothetical protein